VVYEKGVGRTLEGYQGDATIEEKDNRQRADGESHPSKKTGLTRLLGIVLLVAAVLFWVAAPAVLLTPLSAAQKTWTTTAFLVSGEAAFWAAAPGREVFGHYSRCLDPRALLGNKQR
jgi:hypothetical protein